MRTLPTEEAFQKYPNVYGMPLLFPPNRIRDGRFAFRSRTYIFPINEPARNHHIHGLLSVMPFQTAEIRKDRVRLVYREGAQAPYLGFPHIFTVMLK
ncbi:MAG: hypothetical protein ACOX7B_14815 [Christensenellales bacterium]